MRKHSNGRSRAWQRLSPERERHIVRRACDGDRAARDAVVEAFTPLIGSVARTYRNSAVEWEELMQEGCVGLLSALERFDPDIGTPFWAYASWWVRQSMQRLVAEMSRPIVLSDRALRQLARVKDAYRECAQRNGHVPSTKELADRMGVECEHVQTLLAAERPPRSLDEPVGDELDPSRLEERVADPGAEDGYDRVDQRAMADSVRELRNGLGDREQSIIQAHFGLDGPAQTLREIASPLGLSVERVRQLEERGLNRLREAVLSSPECA